MTRLALVLCALAAPVAAHPVPCFPSADIYERLSGKYGEARVGGGLRSTRDGISVVEHWTTPDGSAWTILLTTPDGRSCILASGGEWHATPHVTGRPS